MVPYFLHELEKLVEGKIKGARSISFNQILTDSRKLSASKNSLFVAITGDRHNGHIYIPELYKKGVRCFLVSEMPQKPELYPDAGFLFVNNTLVALQKIAKYHRENFNIPIVGITGSNGKTIVKEWLSQCFGEEYSVTRSPKSYNSQIGVPLSVWLMNSGTNLGIFEAGISKTGEMENLASIIQPTCGIITNIGEAHQKNFNSIQEKVLEKIKLFEHCSSIFYCSDYQEIHKTILETYSEKSIHCWAFNNNEAETKVEIVSRNKSETIVILHGVWAGNSFTIPFSDSASIENCLHIINFLLNNDYKAEKINNCLAKLTPVAMRLEQVKGINNCLLINDTYNSDINSLSIALDYLHQQPFKKRSLILSDIQQSGLPDDVLYLKVADLIRQAEIKCFIGIGDVICRYEEHFNFTDCSFYSSALQFLESGKAFSFHKQAILIKAARSFRFEDIATALSEKNHTTVLEINLDNLTHNLNYFRSLLAPNTGIMVMVKALSYGSGTYEIANLLQHEQVDYLGVAFTDEGIQLRKSGITTPIMVMSPEIEDLNRLIDYNLEPEIYSFSTLKNFVKVAEKMQTSGYPIHIKLDTGMHRLGFMESDIENLKMCLASTETISVSGIFSHLAASDSVDHDQFSKNQIDIFTKLYNYLSRELNIHPKRHILNSAGIERFTFAHFEMVRLGIGLHGVSKSDNLLPVSTLKTHISQIKIIPKGDSIGYNRSGIANKELKIAIIPIGYADGLDRKFGNGNGQVLVKNKQASYIGNICMDMSMIDITDIKCQEGEEVIIFGENNPITKLAEQINTIPYEILTNVSSRVKRLYIKE